ncbi:hypothetical protein AVEN_225201-1 [Araneus ventricosus]|uniref:Uncharacterized protein n=1 Tax=Araneus ventricosus TaxID=182803 RepID=A0A4Y2ANC2_ARAVE|nr:hypothetical protein AVEN_225201-1 [Araneus ventricosus]
MVKIILAPSATIVTVKNEDQSLSILPYLVFDASGTPVTSISFAPLDNCQYLVSSSFDKTLKFFDLRDTSMPFCSIKRGFALDDCKWTKGFCGALVSLHDGIVFKGSSFAKECGTEEFPTQNIAGTVGSLTCSAISDITDMQAIADMTGTVSVNFFHSSCDQIKQPSFDTHVIFETEVVTLDLDERISLDKAVNSEVSSVLNDAMDIIEVVMDKFAKYCEYNSPENLHEVVVSNSDQVEESIRPCYEPDLTNNLLESAITIGTSKRSMEASPVVLNSEGRRLDRTIENKEMPCVSPIFPTSCDVKEKRHFPIEEMLNSTLPIHKKHLENGASNIKKLNISDQLNMSSLPPSDEVICVNNSVIEDSLSSMPVEDASNAVPSSFSKDSSHKHTIESDCGIVLQNCIESVCGIVLHRCVESKLECSSGLQQSIESKSDCNVVPLQSIESECNVVPLQSVESECNVVPLQSVESECSVVPQQSVESECSVAPQQSVESECRVVPQQSVESECRVVPQQSVELECNVVLEQFVESECNVVQQSAETECSAVQQSVEPECNVAQQSVESEHDDVPQQTVVSECIAVYQSTKSECSVVQSTKSECSVVPSTKSECSVVQSTKSECSVVQSTKSECSVVQSTKSECNTTIEKSIESDFHVVLQLKSDVDSSDISNHGEESDDSLSMISECSYASDSCDSIPSFWSDSLAPDTPSESPIPIDDKEELLSLDTPSDCPIPIDDKEEFLSPDTPSECPIPIDDKEEFLSPVSSSSIENKVAFSELSSIPPDENCSSQPAAAEEESVSKMESSVVNTEELMCNGMPITTLSTENELGSCIPSGESDLNHTHASDTPQTVDSSSKLECLLDGEQKSDSVVPNCLLSNESDHIQTINGKSSPTSSNDSVHMLELDTVEELSSPDLFCKPQYPQTSRQFLENVNSSEGTTDAYNSEERTKKLLLEESPVSYASLISTCGLIFKDVNTISTSSDERKDSLPIESNVLSSVNAISWNPNYGCHFWLVTAGNSGVARLICVSELSPQENTSLLDKESIM